MTKDVAHGTFEFQSPEKNVFRMAASVLAVFVVSADFERSPGFDQVVHND